MIVVIVVAAFAPFRSNRMGSLHLLPVALVVSLAVLGKIKAQVAVVALHQFEAFLGPEPFGFQVLSRILNAEVFDEGFGLGAEHPALGDHRAQVQPIDQRRKPLAARLVPIGTTQLVQAHVETEGRFDDLLGALAQGRNQLPGVWLKEPFLFDSVPGEASWGRLIGMGILLVAADLAPEQQVAAQPVGVVPGQVCGLQCP